MFYNEEKAIRACEEEPSLVFELIKEGHFEVVEKLLRRGKIDINTVDDAGNDIVCRLLKAKQYDLVLKYMRKKNWNVNHQNKDGNTFAHILVTINYIHVAKIIDQLKKNKEFLPNIKNNKGETILDKSINGQYIYTTAKILADNRFDNIDLMAFKHLCDTYVKSTYYGAYSKLNNLELIVNSLDEKENLLPSMEKLLLLIKGNFELIKKELLTNRWSNLDSIIDFMLRDAVTATA